MTLEENQNEPWKLRGYSYVGYTGYITTLGKALQSMPL